MGSSALGDPRTRNDPDLRGPTQEDRLSKTYLRWLGITLAFLVIAMAVTSVAMWPYLTDTTTATAATATAGVVAAAGGLVSGVAGAVAAVAAYAAAKESRQTGRDAAEALGLAMEPELMITPNVTRVDPSGSRLVAIITNTSRWAATDVVFEAEFRDGRRISHRTEYVPPRPDPDPRVLVKPSEVIIELGEPRPQPWDAPDWRGDVEIEDRLVLTYSDERRLLRWRKLHIVHRQIRADGRIRSEGSGAAISTERIR